MAASEGDGTPRTPASTREEEEEAVTPGDARTATGPGSTLVSALPDVHRARRTLGLVEGTLGAVGL